MASRRKKGEEGMDNDSLRVVGRFCKIRKAGKVFQADEEGSKKKMTKEI